MTLVLTVASYRGAPPAQPASQRFEGTTITIGRAPDNDWVLPDPEQHLSKKHCIIQLHGGQYSVIDTSTNGVYIGGQPLGSGRSAPLRDGERLYLGDYEIAVAVVTGGDPMAGFGIPDQHAGGFGEVGGLAPFPSVSPSASDGGDPFGAGGFQAAPAPAAMIPGDFSPFSTESGVGAPMGGTAFGSTPLIPENEDWLGGGGAVQADEPWRKQFSAPDHVGAEHGFFRPPQAMPFASATPSANAIPDDWLAPSAAPSAPASAPHSGGFAAPPPAPSFAPPPSPSFGAPEPGGYAPRSPPSFGAPPPGGYAAPPPSPSFGAPPPGGYAAPPPSPSFGAPPPGGYAAPPPPPSFGAPPPGGYAAPPPPPSFGTPPGAYAAPPPAPSPGAPPSGFAAPQPNAFPAPNSFGAPAGAFPAPAPPAFVSDEAPDPGGPFGAPPPRSFVPQPPPAMPDRTILPQHVQAAAPTGAPVRDQGAVAAFLEGAGLPAGRVAPEQAAAVMREVGQVFREMVGGLRDVLQMRAQLKAEYRLDEVTRIGSQNNNPLKFTVDIGQTVAAMIGPPGPGYMPPLSAVKEAFRDVKAHELAMMAGTQAAVTAVFRQFDPEQLKKRLEQSSILTSILPGARKAKYWEIYAAQFKQIQGDITENANSTFGRAFARAYEDQIKKL